MYEDIIVTGRYSFYPQTGPTGTHIPQSFIDNNIFAVCERMMDYGWSKGAIIGAIGCFYAESEMNPGIYEGDGSTTPDTNFPYYGGGIGLAQWTDYPPYEESYPNPVLYACITEGWYEGTNPKWWDGNLQCYMLTKANDSSYTSMGYGEGARWGWLNSSQYPQQFNMSFNDYLLLDERQWEQAVMTWLYCFEAHGIPLTDAQILERKRHAFYAYNLLINFRSRKRGMKVWQMIDYKRYRYRKKIY